MLTIESIQTIIESAAARFREMYMKSWGEAGSSASGRFTLPIDAQHKWIPAISMSVSSKLVIKNLDGANSIEITWNDTMQYGFPIDAGDEITLDDMVGTLYMRPYNPAVAVIVAYMSIGVRQQ